MAQMSEHKWLTSEEYTAMQPGRPTDVTSYNAEGYFDCELFATSTVVDGGVEIQVRIGDDGSPVGDVLLSRADLVDLIAQIDASRPARRKPRMRSPKLPRKG